MNMMRTSIVVPVFNNAATLRELHQRLCNAAAPAGAFEIIYVDDCSFDASRETLREIVARDRRAMVLNNDSRLGQNATLIAGMAAARGDWTLCIDADLQDPPEMIPSIIAAASDRVTAVFATRRGKYQSFGRTVTSAAYKALLSAATGVPARAGLFVLISARTRSMLLSMHEVPSVVAAIGVIGGPFASVPAVRAVRASGRSSYSSVDRLRLAMRTLRWIVRMRRRRFAWNASTSF